MSAAPAPLPFRRALPWVLFISFLFLLNYSARSALSPLFVYLERDFQVGHGQATSLLLVQGIGMCISLAMVGFLMSRITPRRMIALSLVSAGACLACMPLCGSLDTARAIFFAFGLGAGLYLPAAMTTLGSLVAPRDWGKAIGIHELAANLGFVVYPLAAQLLLLLMPWRGAIACWGGLLCLAGVLIDRYGQGGRELIRLPSRRGGLELLRHPPLWAFMFILVMALVGEYGIFNVLQLYLVSVYDLDPDRAARLMAVSRLASPLLVLCGGWAVDCIPVRRFLVFAFGLHAVALVLMSLPDARLALAGMFLQAVSIALPYPGLFKLLAECYPLDLQPVVLSLILPASGLFGSGLAPSLLGLAGETAGFGPALLAVSVLSCCCIPLIATVRRFQAERE
jgi:NNP family nitrate/nitrite transporter-like MFS transporter